VRHRPDAGFTLVEVLVALVVVAIGLAALMVAVSGTARTSGYLRDKTLAQWIALNRIAEVRLTVNKLAQSLSTTSGSATGSSATGSSATSSTNNGDAGELQFAGRTWHYDTRYYDTTFPSTKRIIVRVWAGDAKTKSNPLAEATGFFGSGLSVPGNSNALDWTVGNTAATANCQPSSAANANGMITQPSGSGSSTANCTPNGAVGTQGIAPTTPTTPAPVTPTQ
jgi:type II secretion system protein I